MRSRIVDLALLVGLVAVSGGILWTLFTLGGGPRATPTPAPPAANAGATPATPAGATTAGGASAGARGVVPVDPDAASDAADAPALDATDAAAAEPVDGVPAATGSLADPAPAAPPRVLPEGTLALERVGFSFVTGGPGACGVVLEAWVHVAVSRDLLAAYGCGAEVLVTLDDPAGGRSEVVGVIGDTMNPSFERTVNVYVGTDEDAFAYGLTSGTFAAR